MDRVRNPSKSEGCFLCLVINECIFYFLVYQTELLVLYGPWSFSLGMKIYITAMEINSVDAAAEGRPLEASSILPCVWKGYVTPNEKRKDDRDGYGKKRFCLYENIVAYFCLLVSEEKKNTLVTGSPNLSLSYVQLLQCPATGWTIWFRFEARARIIFFVSVFSLLLRPC
jgi:hypothetical protein